MTPPPRFLGIDFSGGAGPWKASCRHPTVWVATVENRDAPALIDLRPVQALPGAGAPFDRLAALLRAGAYTAAAIDAPFAIPAAHMPPGGYPELLRRVAALPPAPDRPFPAGADLVALAAAIAPLATAKPYRATELGLRVATRSTLWNGPRGGAPFAAACLALLARAGRPVWPWAHGPAMLAEAFPAAQLRTWSLPHQRYGAPDERDARAAILAGLATRLHIAPDAHALMLGSPDALDATIAAFAAIAAADHGPVTDPPPDGLIAVMPATASPIAAGPVTPLFPLFLDLRGRTVLLLGEGEAADRRRATLLRAGAAVRPATRFDPADLEGCALAIGAEAPDPDLHALHAEATRRGIPVNCVDRPALSTFTTPATVERLPLQVAIASSGAAPVLARLLRARIETSLDPAYGRLAALADRLKAETRRRLPDVLRRRRFLERALDGTPAALMLAGDDAAAEAAYLAALATAEADADTPERGLVHFIEPPSGPADLLPLRALRFLGEADIILHAPDEDPAVLELARRDAPREAHQDATARLLTLAAEGRRIVRLSPSQGEPAAIAAAGFTMDLGLCRRPREEAAPPPPGDLRSAS